MVAPFSNRNLARRRQLDVRNQFILKGKFVYEKYLSGFRLLQASKAFIRKSSVFRFIDNPVKNYPKSGLIPNSDVSARYIRFRLKRD
ncbi:hypothetical protein [Campylobacter concisus]